MKFDYSAAVNDLRKGRGRPNAEVRSYNIKQLRKRCYEDQSFHVSLIERYQQGEPGLAELLLDIHEPYIKWFAEKYRFTAFRNDEEDVRQMYRLGLLEGFARFQVDLLNTGGPMSFIRHFLRGALTDWTRHDFSLVRLPARHGKQNKIRKNVFTFSEMSDETSSSDNEPFDDVLQVDPDQDLLDDEELRQALPHLIQHLTRKLDARQKRVLRDRLILEDPKTLAEIGERFGVTREAIRQVESLALRKCAFEATIVGVDPEKFDTFQAWLVDLLYTLEVIEPRRKSQPAVTKSPPQRFGPKPENARFISKKAAT